MPLDPICKKIISDDTEYLSDYGENITISAVPNASINSIHLKKALSGLSET